MCVVCDVCMCDVDICKWFGVCICVLCWVLSLHVVWDYVGGVYMYVMCVHGVHLHAGHMGVCCAFVHSMHVHVCLCAWYVYEHGGMFACGIYMYVVYM